MKRFCTTLFILMLTMVWLRPAPSAAASLEHVSIQLQWLDQFQFAGYYIAKEMGFYAKAGLDVEILPFAQGNPTVVDDVMSGKAQYGTGRTSLIIDYNEGKPVVALSAIFQHSPQILLTRDDTGIKTLRDLKGRRVMSNSDVSNSISNLALLYVHGLTLSDIKLQKHSYNLQDLIDKKTDAMSSYLSNEPFRMTELGIGYRSFHAKNFGLSFYDDILFTSLNEVKNHPERAQAFIQASLQGWAYAFKHIEETAQLIKDKYDGQKKSMASLIYEGHELKKLALIEGVPLGEISLIKLKKIEEYYRLMNVKLAEKPLDNFTWNHARQNNGLYFTQAEQNFINNTVIKAATTTNWPPFAFVANDTNKTTGIGYDYWTEIIKAAGLTAKITKFDNFTEQLQSLKDKHQDLMYSSGITEERKKFAKFTEPYASFPISIATSKEENFIQDARFLINKKIAIGHNFTSHKLMLEAFPDFDYVLVKSAHEGLQLVSNGGAYAYIDIMPTLAYAINKYGFTNLKISGNTGLIFELRLMIRDDYPELVSIANKVIAHFDPNLKREILNRWVNVQYDQAFDYTEYFPHSLLFLLVIIVIVIGLHRSKTRAHFANKELEIRVNARTSELLERTKELQESQGQLLKLSQALEQSPSLVFMTDTDANIEYVNPKFLQTTGYTMEEVIGQNPRILKSKKTPPALYKELWQTISAGKTWRGEIHDRCKDGSSFWAKASISPIRDNDGHISHYLAIHEDITKHRESEIAMKYAVEQSEIANRSKTELLANMSHELRTPLNAIIGFSDTMVNQIFGPINNNKYLEYANDIYQSGTHLLELINDILDFSSLEAGKISLSEDVIDLAEVLDASLRLIAPRFDEGHIKISRHYDSRVPKVLADKRRIKQIALNILSNAAKFTEKGGKVSITVTLDHEKNIKIVFSDTGIGMNSKNLDIAMTRFGQVDGSLARKHQGTGLGLPLTQKLVESHGGVFSIKSKQGVGTSITITLPKKRAVKKRKKKADVV